MTRSALDLTIPAAREAALDVALEDGEVTLAIRFKDGAHARLWFETFREAALAGETFRVVIRKPAVLADER